MIELPKIQGIYKSYGYLSGGLKALLIIYDDYSCGIDVKSPLKIKDLINIVKKSRKIMQELDRSLTCYCKVTNKEGNKLAKVLGFTQVHCKLGYNVYRYDTCNTLKHTDFNSC